MKDHLHRKLLRIKSNLTKAGVALMALPANAALPSMLVRNAGVTTKGYGFNVTIEDGYVRFRVWPTSEAPSETYGSVTAGIRRIKELFS